MTCTLSDLGKLWQSAVPATSTRRPRRVCLRLEEFEPRQLLSGVPPTDLEQVFLERLNDARANPAAYGAAIGVNLAGVAPSQPLAFNPALIQSARLHSQDMVAHGYVDHVGPDGLSPGDRMAQAGFPAVAWAESIAAGYPGPEEALKGLVIDNGVPDLAHRRQLLALDAVYQRLNQTGVGINVTGGPYGSYYTIDSGADADNRPFLTGVVFNDANGNGRYDAGEGLGNVTVTVAGVGSAVTYATGGYSLRVSPGTYTVTASGPGLPAPLVQVVTVGGVNARLNFNRAATPTLVPTPDAVPVVAVRDAFNRPLLFATGTDDQVYFQRFDESAHPVGGYTLAAIGQVKSFSVGRDGAGNPEVFAVGLNDLVYALKFDAADNPVGVYSFTTGSQVKSVTATQDTYGRPELFAVGLDNQVYALKFDAAGDPSGAYFLTSGGQVKSLAVGSDSAGRPETFVIGMDDQVYAAKFTADGFPAVGYFLTTPGRVKSIAVGHDAYGRPEVFAVGLDDFVYAQRFTNFGDPLPGYVAVMQCPVKRLTVGYDAANRPLLIGIALDGQVYSTGLTVDGLAGAPSQLTRPGRVKAITPVQDAYNRPSLFAIGLDDQVYSLPMDPSGNPTGDYNLTAWGRVK